MKPFPLFVSNGRLPVVRSGPFGTIAIVSSSPGGRVRMVLRFGRRTGRGSVRSCPRSGRKPQLFLALDLHDAGIVDGNLDRAEADIPDRPGDLRHNRFESAIVGASAGIFYFVRSHVIYPIRLLGCWPKKIRWRNAGPPCPGPRLRPGSGCRPAWWSPGSRRWRRERLS